MPSLYSQLQLDNVASSTPQLYSEGSGFESRCREADILTDVFYGLPESLLEPISRIVSLLMHDRFFPNHYQFIIHQ
jgi:hypothetical protein